MSTETEKFELAVAATAAEKDYQSAHVAFLAAQTIHAKVTVVVALLRARDARLARVLVDALDAAMDALDEDEVNDYVLGADAKRAVDAVRCMRFPPDVPHPLEDPTDPDVEVCCALFESIYQD